MRKPKLLDLFCGAGGASKGYNDAGFEVFGVDHKPMKNYLYSFTQADALDILRYEDLSEFDVIHASPPCQRYSQNRFTSVEKGLNHPDYIVEVRQLLQQTGKLYVIENVEGAPLQYPIMLCGTMFDLEFFRHRIFESNLLLLSQKHLQHNVKCSPQGRKPEAGKMMTITGCFSGVEEARRRMQIDWMVRDELSQAIPPAYTEYLGKQLINALGNQRVIEERMAA